MAVSSALFFLLCPSAQHPSSGSSLSALSADEPIASPILISELYAAATLADEYLVLSSLSSSPLSLDGWSVTDGEGTLAFAPSVLIPPGASATISWNSSSFLAAYERLPEIPLDAPEAAALVSRSGSFRLADDGDSISLLAPDGRVADFVCYGATDETSDQWDGAPVPRPRQGEVIKRIGESAYLSDNNRADDWMHFREFRYGYTSCQTDAFSLPAGSVTAFSSPDCSLDVVLGTIRSSSRSIVLCSYELSSAAVCQALLECRGKGVDVRVLVEGNPAGGMDERMEACLSVLSRNGVYVKTIQGNLSDDVVRHVGYVHSKYLVVDNKSSIVMSENFVESGVPSDKLFGNRGWGVLVESEPVAGLVAGLFLEDSRPSRPDVVDWRSDRRYNESASLPQEITSEHDSGVLRPLTNTEPISLRMYISPDASPVRPFLVDQIAGSSSMLVEQFQADLLWKDRWDGDLDTSPLVSAIVSKIRSGARTHVILDSSWFNIERNTEVVETFKSNITESGSDSVCVLMDPRSPVTVLHNKGAVLDSSRILVSSNNWCRASFAENRELAVVLDSPQLAQYFIKAFEMDLEADAVAPSADAGDDVCVAIGDRVVLDGTGSFDDRAIANWTWDIGADGVPDGYGAVWEFPALEPGTRKVLLTVRDSWGAEDTDLVAVTVVVPSGGGSPWFLGWRWLEALVFVAAFALGATASRLVIARSRVRAARKVNHPRPGSP